MQEEGPILGADLSWFARSLAEGVASVHACGVLHRDVKPSNVLMEGRRPILIDFGLARVADDPRLTHTGWLLGTPGYLPPEILYGDDATAASDVHSWAATVAYAGLGQSPYGTGPAMAIMDRVRRGDHDLTGLPDALRRLLDRALDPEPCPPADASRRSGTCSTPTATRGRRCPTRPPEETEDLFTMPLAIAAQAGLLPRVDPDGVTEVRPTEVEPPPGGTRRPELGRSRTSARTSGTTTGTTTRLLSAQGWVGPPPPPPASRVERGRRALLLTATAVTTGAARRGVPVPRRGRRPARHLAAAQRLDDGQCRR